MWKAWQLDHLTVGWIFWIAFFAVWETYTIVAHRGQELTAHLRPVFAVQPVTWWITLGLWLWIGVHFLAPSLEHRMLEMLTR